VSHTHEINGMLCRHVALGARQTRLVIHEYSGMWVFTCGEDDHPEIDAYVGVCLQCVMKRMDVFPELGHLARGQWAERPRDTAKLWAINTMPPEEEVG
jgi:hypothetical protein